jgi:hypothetical protein
MRLIALVAVVAIIYSVYGKKKDTKGTNARIGAAQAEAAKVIPAQQPPAIQQAAAAPAPAAQSGGLRAPIDRTRAALDLVKERNE